MEEFWKSELSLFKEDIKNFKDFWSQPISFSDNASLMLKPTINEVETKVQDEASSNSFWKNEWNMFLKEVEDVKDFFVQPVVFK